MQSAGSLASLPDGIQAAAGRAGAYALALGLGAIFGAWAAGWDCTGADALAFEFLESRLGLRRPLAPLVVMLWGLASGAYLWLEWRTWTLLNLTSVLTTWYLFAACGAGKAMPLVVIILPARPSPWRLPGVLALHLAIYLTGKVLGAPDAGSSSGGDRTG